MPAASPYAVLFAFSMASCSEANVSTESTGPKSSVVMLSAWLTPVQSRIVGA